MGTSSARRAPTGRLWRLAKAAATRYMSPAHDGAVDAREVAARYIAALGETWEAGGAGALAAFRLTRKAAQNLGAFCCQVESQGWPAALSAWGLAELTGEEMEILAQSLTAALEVPGGGLEQAVAHTALMEVLIPLAGVPRNIEAPVLLGNSQEAARLVQRFLEAAFKQRLTLDLGESLEAAAEGFAPLQQGLAAMAHCINQAAEAAGPPATPPRAPEHWLGLPGWTWVTEMLTGLLEQLASSQPGSK